EQQVDAECRMSRCRARFETLVTKGVTPAGVQKLTGCLNGRAGRSPNWGKCISNLRRCSSISSRHVCSLERPVNHQREDIATAPPQLPGIREQINWLTTSFYEQKGKGGESAHERLNRHAARGTDGEDNRTAPAISPRC